MIFINPDYRPFLEEAKRLVEWHDHILKVPEKSNADIINARVNFIKLLKKLKNIACKNNTLDNKKNYDYCYDRDEVVKELSSVETLIWQLKKQFVLYN